MQKSTSTLFSTTRLLFLIFVGLSWIVLPSALAAIPVGDNLSLFGDFRFRYEIDDQDDSSVDRERDRARIRARFGFKYAWSKNVSFGLRLRTESDNNQSPHHTLGLLGSKSDSGTHEEFGLDRAHIDIKFLDGGFLWLGKHGISWWQQNEAFWDGDIQPEGAGLGYKFKLGDAGSLTLQSVFTYLDENSWGPAGDTDGIFNDDSGTTIQGVYTRSMGKYTITVASGALFIADKEDTSIRGGSTTYTSTGVQLKTKSIPKLPITLGFDYLYSTYDETGSGVAGVDATLVGVDDANEGFVINLAAKYGSWGFKFEHYDIELNSVPAQGALAQDDFRFSSNFTGQKYQISYKFGKGYQIDLRAYPQEVINNTIANNSDPQMGVDDNTRYQVNLNIKF